MSQAALDLMQMFLKWYHPEGPSATQRRDYLNRPLVCTPYAGSYGKISGWVVCVNGSPPKGTLVIAGETRPQAAFRLGKKSQRVTGDKQLVVVQNFFEHHLKGKEASFEVSSLLDG